MKSADRRRIEELEKRVRDLEARPYWPPTIIIQPAPQPAPYLAPYPFLPWVNPQPWVQPIWYVDHSTLPQVTVTTSGAIS